MSRHSLKIYATDVDEAREHIFQCVRRMPHKAIYFDGWNGFGASVVLRSIAEVLPSRRTTPELCFDRVIYIDCSECKNRRAIQRAIAEELKLDSSVVGILDRQDEDDDFGGVDTGSRYEIDTVGQVIYQALKNSKFMMIFINGSDDEVDMGAFGIPPFTKFSNNTMIWTFKRSFLTMHRHQYEIEDKLRHTTFFLYSILVTSSQFQAILGEEAATIVARNPSMLGIDPTMVMECCLYKLFLHCNFHPATRFDWVAHASNYWICDRIMQWDIARDIIHALHREINWKCDSSLLDDVLQKFMKQLSPPFLVLKDDGVYEEGTYHWISVTSRNTKVCGLQTIPADTSSFFLAFEGPYYPSTLQNGLFEHASKLGVLVLYCSVFNFASPPFLKCHSLRFLGVDRCEDGNTDEGEDHIDWACLYRLQVLDLRYTDWNEILSQERMVLMTDIRELNIEGVDCWQYAAHLQGCLPNLQSLRIIKPRCKRQISKDVDNSFVDKTRMEILDLSGNSDMKILPRSLAKAGSLQMLVLDGCDELEKVVLPDGLPPSLNTFSFDGYGPASQWTQTIELPPNHCRLPTAVDNEKDISVSKISLAGCTQLENLFLRGLPNLVELDLSGTAIKVLDFETMVVHVPRLKRLFLIGCVHLHAIKPWCKRGNSEMLPNLELLCIDTRAGIGCSRPSINKNKSFSLQVHAVVEDARLARSLEFLMDFMGDCEDVYFNIHINSSPMYAGVSQLEASCKGKIGASDQVSMQQLVPAGCYDDVLSMVGDPPISAPTQTFTQPPTVMLDRHIEIAQGSRCVESELDGCLGQLIDYFTESLHVHDVSVSAIMPELHWGRALKHCCVERCPKLDPVFPSYSAFDSLETLWVSDLLIARWICSKPISRYRSLFRNLQHLHVSSCPSLQFGLPAMFSFPSLETLHIIHCGDLKHVFILDEKCPEEIAAYGVAFPKLRTIYLHNLLKLQQICQVKMVAPALESIKIRGCSGLRRLPAVAARSQLEKKRTIEIEKDIWDALEWDGVEAGHHPCLFEAPVHSSYYKKKLPRVSVLR